MATSAGNLPHHEQNAVTANLTCFIAMVMWAFTFPVAEILLETWGSMALILIRHAIAVAILMLIWIALDGWSIVAGANWRRAMGVGGIGFGIGAILFLVGQDLSDAVTPAIAAAMMPIIGAVLEILFDGRRIRARLLAGIALAVTGGLLATGTRLDEGNFGWGSLLCLVSVILFAWATRATNRGFSDLSTLGQATITLSGGFVSIVLIYLLALALGLPGPEIGDHDAYHLWLLVLTAVFSSALAQFLWIRSNAGLGILLASFHMNAVPFYVMVILVIFLGSSWNWWQAAGAAAVGVGVFLAQSGARSTAPAQRER